MQKYVLNFCGFDTHTLAEKLRYYRYQKGLKQTDVARILGISRDTYRAYESDKKTACPEHIRDKLSLLYGISSTEFI